MVNKIWLNRLILIGLLTYIFIVMEISLFLLSAKLYLIISIFDFVALSIIFSCIYIVLIYFIINSRAIRLYFSIIFAVAPGIILIFILCFSGFDQFIFLKIQLLIVFPISLLNLYYCVRFLTVKHKITLNLGRYAKIGFVLIPVLLGSILFLPLSIITINPKTEPEIIFWTSARGLPSNSTLDYCGDNSIGFAVVLREEYIDDGGATELRHIKRALDRDVEIEIAIGGHMDQFYATINNADDFPDIFKEIRTWLKAGNIYDDIDTFLIDAEPPVALIDDMATYSYSEKSENFLKQIPTDKRVNHAKNSFDDFCDLIHDDDKEIGIVKMPSITDELDNDNDYSRVVNNIYNIDLDFDFSVSMIYRTQHLPDLFDYFIDDMNKYDYISDYEIEYTEKGDLEKYLMPTSSFFYKVAYEISSSEVDIPKNHRYVFIGVFSKKFEGTSYIENRDYRKDLDICRHFGINKIYFYDFSGFKFQYGSSELKEVVSHISEKTQWFLAIPAFYLKRELLVSLVYATIDRLIVL